MEMENNTKEEVQVEKTNEDVSLNPTKTEPMAEVEQMPTAPTQTAVQKPEHEEMVTDLRNFFLRLLTKILENFGKKPAYSKKQLDELKKTNDTLTKALESNQLTPELIGEIGASIVEASKASERGDVAACIEDMSRAQYIAVSKGMNKMFDGKHDLKLIERDDGRMFIFNPSGGINGEISLVEIKDGRMEGFYFDLEQYQKEVDPDFQISGDQFSKQANPDDLCLTGRQAWSELKADLNQKTEERVIETEMKSPVSVEKLNEVAEYLKAQNVEGMELTVDEKNSTILVTNNKDGVDEKLLIVLATNDKGIEGISSIRQIEDKEFTGKDFDKEEILRNSTDLIYCGKVTVLDRSKTPAKWTVQDKFMANESLDGAAKDLMEALMTNMEVDIVKEIEEEREFDEPEKDDPGKDSEERF